jgi:hypothetical protein
MKVAELEGVLLDYWVARAEWKGSPRASEFIRHDKKDKSVRINGCVFRPSSNWITGGGIIENKKISLLCHFGLWDAKLNCAEQAPWSGMISHSPLIAAMRAYVASKFGDEVPELEA